MLTLTQKQWLKDNGQGRKAQRKDNNDLHKARSQAKHLSKQHPGRTYAVIGGNEFYNGRYIPINALELWDYEAIEADSFWTAGEREPKGKSL